MIAELLLCLCVCVSVLFLVWERRRCTPWRRPGWPPRGGSERLFVFLVYSSRPMFLLVYPINSSAFSLKSAVILLQSNRSGMFWVTGTVTIFRVFLMTFANDLALSSAKCKLENLKETNSSKFVDTTCFPAAVYSNAFMGSAQEVKGCFMKGIRHESMIFTRSGISS